MLDTNFICISFVCWLAERWLSLLDSIAIEDQLFVAFCNTRKSLLLRLFNPPSGAGACRRRAEVPLMPRYTRCRSHYPDSRRSILEHAMITLRSRTTERSPMRKNRSQAFFIYKLSRKFTPKSDSVRQIPKFSVLLFMCPV